jgi:ribonucleoside-diphosphate reductase alpha chain
MHSVIRKRDGTSQQVSETKLIRYIKTLSNIEPPLRGIHPAFLANKIFKSMGSEMTSSDVPTHIAETSAALVTRNHNYGMVAGRALVAQLHDDTSESFSHAMLLLANKGFMNKDFIALIKQHGAEYDEMICHERDFGYDIFGMKTLQRSYLLRIDGTIVERPQYMLMRVAIALHGDSLADVEKTYEALSLRYYTHATPTLFNSGTKLQQMASCFLMTMQSDSVRGIYDTLKQCALISKGAGGIGLSIGNIRASGADIRGTNGTSNGLAPMLRVFNQTARYIDQGGGKRKGSFAMFLETHHPDLLSFLDLKKNHGVEEDRARDLFYGLWISDLFMKRVEKGGVWSFFCPHACPDLQDAWGEQYEQKYFAYEAAGKAHHTMPARQVWQAILTSQIETGTPYMCFKDSINRKSPQQNLGTIRGSNLCVEICLYTDANEIAVCTLSSIALPKFVQGSQFRFDHLENVTRLVTRNLDRTIDVNAYPVPEAKRSNFRHRPIGIGVQGLADVYAMLKLPYDSDGAKALNKQIFESMYFAALDESCKLAQEKGPYTSFMGSPASKGILQFDMWDVTPSDRYDWDGLKRRIQEHGLRNSQLMANMPTASTAQILGNTESFEPRTSNLYTRRVLAGEYMVLNRYLQEDLQALDLWNEDMVQHIIANRGSIQHAPNIPQQLKDVYKTVWEIKQKACMEQAVDRGAYICNSQSLNLYAEEPSMNKLNSMYFYAWRSGLKTGGYYLRTRPKAKPIQFTVNAPKAVVNAVEDDGDVCMTCSS